MERIQIDARSAVAGGVLGCALGAGASWLVCRRYLARRFDERLDAESTALKEHYHRREILTAAAQALNDASGPEAAESAGSDVDGVVTEAVVAEDGLALSDDPAKVEQWIRDQVGPIVDAELNAAGGDSDVEAALSPEHVSAGVEEGTDPLTKDRDTSKPYVISYEEFLEPVEGYQQLTITFYAADGVLCDDKDDPIPNIKRTTGELSPLGFGGISKDPHIRYVRNERMELDFEIILNAGSYADAVLNYGKPPPGDGS